MSPKILGLSILGLTTVSTGIGIAVVNLTNTNNESIEKKIKELWEVIKGNIGLLTSKIDKIAQNKDLATKYAPILAKIKNIADSTTQNSTTTYTLKESYKKTQESYQQLQKINQELQEIIKFLN